MSSKPHDIACDAPTPLLDFRAFDDDAWYAVRFALDGETLIVKFYDFGEEFDAQFQASGFKDLKELESFAERFRPTSVQLQDKECRKVIEGMTVCASDIFEDNDLKFYDAVIEEVHSLDHTFNEGEEECSCIFVLFWQHGPKAGIKTSTTIEHICLIKPETAEKDPALDSFLEMTRKKLELGSQSSYFSTECENPASKGGRGHSKTCGSTAKYETRAPDRPQICNSEEKNPRWHNTTQAFKVGSNVRKRLGQDTDLGVEYLPWKRLKETSCYLILIENLEKDLSPSAIVNFIYQQTSVLAQAYVFPSLFSESFTGGAIVLESQEKLEKLVGFLDNPAYLILSWRGRPWVISKSEWKPETFWSFILKLERLPLNKNEAFDNKIKVVHKGTMEYEKGKQLKKLFIEFRQHIQCLHKRLTLDERKILQSA